MYRRLLCHSRSRTVSLTLDFAHSSYNIVTLNETLPPFTARNYTLVPFEIPTMNDSGAEHSETRERTAPTTLHGLDMHCEPAIESETFSGEYNNSGCATSGLSMGKKKTDQFRTE